MEETLEDTRQADLVTLDIGITRTYKINMLFLLIYYCVVFLYYCKLEEIVKFRFLPYDASCGRGII